MSNVNAPKRFIQKSLFTALIVLTAIIVIGCSSQAVVPFEPTSQLDYHNGYWVMEVVPPGSSVKIKVINDMHIDLATNRATVYAQTKALGRVVGPPQVGPDECTENNDGKTVCFHPNAVYLNGSGEELMEADGTGEWWVKHSWIVDGEGYYNCEMVSEENYDDYCTWVEGVLLEDGLTMEIGGIIDEEIGAWYGNQRTPLFHDDGSVTYTVTRFEPVNTDPAAGEIDLTLETGFALEFMCEEEISPFNNLTRECPTAQN